MPSNKVVLSSNTGFSVVPSFSDESVIVVCFFDDKVVNSVLSTIFVVSIFPYLSVV